MRFAQRKSITVCLSAFGRFRSAAEKEIRRLYPRTPKLNLPAIHFLRRLAQRQVAFLRRVPQDSRLLHLPRKRLRSFPIIPIITF